MQDSTIKKYFFLSLFLIAMTLTAAILWPFAKVLVLAIALSAVLAPVYDFFKQHIKFPWLASLATLIVFIVVLCIPLFFVGTLVFNQSQSLYAWVVDHGGFNNITQIFNQSIEHVFPHGAINLKDNVASMVENFSSKIGVVFTATLSTLFSFLLLILSMFYFLKDGAQWKKIIIHLMPFSDESGHKIFTTLIVAVKGIVKGYLSIGIVQGILMGIGLQIFGVPNAALWGVLAAVASLVPTVGTALVAIPAIIFLVISGNTGGAIGFGIWAAVLVGTVDNFLNPYIVGKRIEIHPILVLFSVLGGIALMGPIGILVGPLVISFLYSLASIYKTEIQ